MTATLERTTFETSRLMEFFTEKELDMQIGHERELWPLALVKELIDNALDACESKDIAPEIAVIVEDDSVSVRDNGPGLPVATLERSLDYLVRVSDKANYVSPTRGQLGNALKCVWSAPFVVNGEHGCVDVITGGLMHQIDVTLDRIAQQPRLQHTTCMDGLVKTGTLVRMHWPGIASYLRDRKPGHFYNTPDIWNVSDLIRGYVAFNPHAAFAGDGSKYPRVDEKWRKWRPSEPTSPHWYDAERLRNLIAAYIARERAGGRVRTVREFVSEFAGLSGTAKQKAVTAAAGLSGAYLHDLAEGDSVSMDVLTRLLDAMRSESKVIKPEALGVLGKQHLTNHLVDHHNVTASSVKYKVYKGNEDDLPYVLEVAFGVREENAEDKGRKIITGLNWTPTLDVPFDELRQVLGSMRVDPRDPVVVVVHLAKPSLQFTDRGKGRLEL